MTFFDWISPLLQMVDGIRGMKTVGLCVPGRTPNELIRRLNENGVRTGTGMLLDGELVIPVSDEKKAYRVAAEMKPQYPWWRR